MAQITYVEPVLSLSCEHTAGYGGTWPHTDMLQYGFCIGHTLPQPAQFLASMAMFTSQPLLPTAVVLSQSAKPGEHTSKVHWLFTHLVLALGMLHMGQVQALLMHTRPWAHLLPQPPQLFTSLPVVVSQPFLGLPSQSVKPMLHCLIWQAAFTHPDT